MPVYGLGQGALPIAGFAYGARNFDRVKETTIKAAVFSLAFLSIAWTALHLNAAWIMGCFSDDAEFINL